MEDRSPSINKRRHAPGHGIDDRSRERPLRPDIHRSTALNINGEDLGNRAERVLAGRISEADRSPIAMTVVSPRFPVPGAPEVRRSRKTTRDEDA